MARRIKQPHGGEIVNWEKGESGNMAGRPPKVLTVLQEKLKITFDVNISWTDKRQIIESMLELRVSQLEKIAKNGNSPAFMVAVAKAIIRDTKNGEISVLETIFNRLHGRPAASLTVSVPPTSPIRKEDAEEAHAELYTQWEPVE